jgi:hypothetical protein
MTFLFILVPLLALFAIESVLTPGSKGSGPDDVDACVMSRVFVKRNIKSPSTAEFPICDEPDVRVKQTDGTWIVSSYVDAQNGFGATLRANTVVQMTYNSSSDTWALVDIAIIAP